MKTKLLSSYLIWLTLSALLLLTGCASFPQDPRQTLNQALERGTLKVGVSDHSPWVMGHPPATPSGVEALLLTEFAAEIGVDIEWYWGSAAQHFEALQRYELDVVIGGFTDSNPWSEHVGLTIPYYTSQVIIGVPPSAPMIADLDGVAVAVRPGSGWQDKLQERGAEVVIQSKLMDSDIPIAAEVWEVEGLGFHKSNIQLREYQHVIAVPPGENGLLIRLEEFLFQYTNEDQIAQLLWEFKNQ